MSKLVQVTGSEMLSVNLKTDLHIKYYMLSRKFCVDNAL